MKKVWIQMQYCTKYSFEQRIIMNIENFIIAPLSICKVIWQFLANLIRKLRGNVEIEIHGVWILHAFLCDLKLELA